MKKKILGSLCLTAGLALLMPCSLPAQVSAPEPTPRLADETVDLGGKGAWAPIWVLERASNCYAEKALEIPFTESGKKLYDERIATKSKDDPEGYCLPAGVPRYTGTPCPFNYKKPWTTALNVRWEKGWEIKE